MLARSGDLRAQAADEFEVVELEVSLPGARDFTGVLKDHGIGISMDGKGRWTDNVFIERLWRSLKSECVHLHDFENGIEARDGIARWIDFYNHERPRSALGDTTPMARYSLPPVA